MASVKDICRICVQETDYNDVQEIDLDKLKRLIQQSLLPKWDVDLYHDHIICNICIDTFRTSETLNKYAKKANKIVMSIRRKHRRFKIDLSKFQYMPRDLFICRLCLGATKHVAIYLNDSPTNIMPLKYVNMMLKYTRLTLWLLADTINPILCFQCWQRLQVTFSFQKHLEIVTEKVLYYQTLLKKFYINKEDLQDILHMWDKLGTVPTEIISVESESSMSELSIEGGETPETPPNYLHFEEHNYSKKKNVTGIIEQDISVLNSVQSENNSLVDVEDDMPVLMQINENIEHVKSNQNLSVSNRSLLSETNSVMDVEGDMPLLIRVNENIKQVKCPNMSDSRALLSKTNCRVDVEDDMPMLTRINEDIKQVKYNMSGRSLPLKTNSRVGVKDDMPVIRQINEDMKQVKYSNAPNKSLLSETNSLVDVDDDMPLLMRINKDIKQVKYVNTSDRTLRRSIRASNAKKPIYNFKKPKKQENKKLSKTKSSKNKTDLAAQLLNGNTDGIATLSKSKQKLVSLLKSKMQQSMLETYKKDNNLRYSARLCAKSEVINDFSSRDLLVLQKEEIIKKKRVKNTKSLTPEFASTPKIKEYPQLTAIPDKQGPKSPLKYPTSNEYTFERLNFDNEVQFDKDSIVEEEIQIKKEVISDSDDDFIENTASVANECDVLEKEQCPNLDAFIKTEPEEIIDEIDDEDGPPELEFQGPCNYDPKFTISDTFSVNDKRQLINTVDEKRGLLAQQIPVVETKDQLVAVNMGKVKKPVNKCAQNSLVDPIVKASLETDFIPLAKEVVINLSKCDKNDVVEFESNANLITTASSIVEKSPLKEVRIIQRKRQTQTQPKQDRSRIVSNVVPNVVTNESSSTSAPETQNVLSLRMFRKKSETLETKKPLATTPTDKKVFSSELFEDIFTSQSDGYRCKKCGFITTSLNIATFHVARHPIIIRCPYHNCPYQSATQKNLTSHFFRAHSELRTKNCDICGLRHSVPLIKCPTCLKLLHPTCLLEDQDRKQFDCSHFGVLACLVIWTTGGVTDWIMSCSLEERLAKCNFCLKDTLHWVNCRDCSQFFHFKCFFYSRTINDRNLCQHILRESKTNAIPLKSRQEKKQAKAVICDLCGYDLVLDKSVIPCSSCLKYMHKTCFIKDSKETKFNSCKHANVVGEIPNGSAMAPIKERSSQFIYNRREWKKLVEDPQKHEERNKKRRERYARRRQNKTESALAPTEKKKDQFKYNKREWKKHLKDPQEHEEDKKKQRPGKHAKRKQNKSGNTPGIPEPTASTSKETKQEMIDLSDFIMLCD